MHLTILCYKIACLMWLMYEKLAIEVSIIAFDRACNDFTW